MQQEEDVPQETYLLKSSAEEITRLRQKNSVQDAKLTVFDQMMSLFNNAPLSKGGMAQSPDLVYKINRFLQEKKEVVIYKTAGAILKESMLLDGLLCNIRVLVDNNLTQSAMPSLQVRVEGPLGYILDLEEELKDHAPSLGWILPADQIRSIIIPYFAVIHYAVADLFSIRILPPEKQ